MQRTKKTQLVVITGMSGAGKTIAAHSLEDIGFFCIDNFPPILIQKLTELLMQAEGCIKKVAVVADLRGGEFFAHLLDTLDQLDKETAYQILFLDATDSSLVRRYKSTRRKHPLSSSLNLLESIKKERKLLEKVKNRANLIIDTSELGPADLKQTLKLQFTDTDINKMTLNFISFGFKHGIPIDADLVFDVRFLTNPYYIKELCPLNGLDCKVSEYVMNQPETKTLVEKLTDLLVFLVPQYKKEGKSQIIVGIGCTGGQHRSVAIVENLSKLFCKNELVHTTHRDMHKGEASHVNH